MKQVCLKTASWIFVLMLTVPGSVLFAEDPPSSQDQAVRDGQPASTAPVPPALRQALASSLGKAASFGAKAIPAPPAGSWGIVSEGDGGGGIFRDSDSDAEAWLGAEEVGVHGFGALAGGHFEDSDSTGYAWVGHADVGIEAGGSRAGGLFVDSDDDGEAWVGHGNFGIEARGSEMGGYFEDSDGTGFAHLGWGNTGVFGRGNVAGGVFDDEDGSGYARAGYGDRGVDAGGNEMGGYFVDSDGSGYTRAGYGDLGLAAGGTQAGGYFEDADPQDSGHAYVGIDNTGVLGRGNVAGGVFEDNDGSGWAKIGYERVEGYDRGGDPNDGDYGVYGGGNYAGAYFENAASGSYGYVAIGGLGFWGFGSNGGGGFEDTDSGNWGAVGFDTSKIFGMGSVNFVQNHPYDPDSVIVYTAPEGDEVATYTRGTARLVDGEATVPLGETFEWVTNPDIGLTVFLTPVGNFCDLYVVEKSTEQITVHSRDGLDCTFDFLVYGLRIGFEETSVVQEKEREAYIPSMSSHRQRYERRPDLKTYNSLERFKGMRREANPKAELDLSRAQALRDAIIEFDPAVHELPMPAGFEEMPAAGFALDEDQREGVQGHERVRAARPGHHRRSTTDHPALGTTIPVDNEGNVYAPSFRPSSQDLASLVTVSETVEPGDVLVIDTDRRGLMRRGSSAADNGVVGIVAAAPGLVLGSEVEIGQPEAPAEREQNSDFQLKVPVAFSGVVDCKVDASYGAVWTGNLLVTSPTPGHAMAQQAPLPGTVLGKALEPLEKGVGTIKVLVMLR